MVRFAIIFILPMLLLYFMDAPLERHKFLPLPTDGFCASDSPDGHAFLVMGTDDIFLDHLPRIYHVNHNYQLVCKAVFPDSIKSKFVEDFKLGQDSFYMLVNREKFILPDMANGRVASFPAVILKMGPDIKGRMFIDQFSVDIEKVIRFRPFSKNIQQTDTLEYLLFGNRDELYISNKINVEPDFYQTSQVRTPTISFEEIDIELGLDIKLLDYFRTSPCQQPSASLVHVIPMQPEGQEFSLEIERNLLFTTAEVNTENPCQ